MKRWLDMPSDEARNAWKGLSPASSSKMAGPDSGSDVPPYSKRSVQSWRRRRSERCSSLNSFVCTHAPEIFMLSTVGISLNNPSCSRGEAALHGYFAIAARTWFTALR